MNLDERFMQYKLNAYMPEETVMAPEIVVKPEETLQEIKQTPFERTLEATGLTLEDVGAALDSIGKINIKGVEIGLRDLLPFVGSIEDGKVIGTPAALQAAGRGESLIKGKGMAAELSPDAKLMAADALTAGVAVPAAKGIAKGISKLTKAKLTKAVK
jgi:hypothetical protein